VNIFRADNAGNKSAERLVLRVPFIARIEADNTAWTLIESCAPKCFRRPQANLVALKVDTTQRGSKPRHVCQDASQDVGTAASASAL
jgi:hypothetical protein